MTYIVSRGALNSTHSLTQSEHDVVAQMSNGSRNVHECRLLQYLFETSVVSI